MIENTPDSPIPQKGQWISPTVGHVTVTPLRELLAKMTRGSAHLSHMDPACLGPLKAYRPRVELWAVWGRSWAGSGMGRERFWSWNSLCHDAIPIFPVLSSYVSQQNSWCGSEKNQAAYQKIRNHFYLLLPGCLVVPSCPPTLHAAHAPSARLHGRRQWGIGALLCVFYCKLHGLNCFQGTTVELIRTLSAGVPKHF